MKFYLVYKNNGLYDPVLDDQEPIYYEPGDLDPESQPTEVPFKIQHFLEPADLGSSLIDYGDTNDPLGTPFDPSVLLTESRSLTASPYMNPVKPYRPFSTEPLPEVPALEDPIILNPDHQDTFGKGPNDNDSDYILNAYNTDNGIEGRFKLPISKQYDPDGKRQVINSEVDSFLSKYVNIEMLSRNSMTSDKTICKKTVKDISKHDTILTDDVKFKESIKSSIREENTSVLIKDISSKEEVMTHDETITKNTHQGIMTDKIKHVENLIQDLDVVQIEKTALSVVEDSIDRAVTVADEIRKEIDVELALEQESTNVINEKDQKMKLSSETTDIHETEFEEIDKIASNKEHLQYSENKVSEQFIKTEDIKISQNMSKHDTKMTSESKLGSFSYDQEPTTEEIITRDTKSSEDSTRNSKNFKTISQTATTSTKSNTSGAHQRTYEIGLQTIPNIRGVVHSSYHYDLLLRTFFLHLTDVMVALSRFLLSQPIFNNTASSEMQETVSKTGMCEKNIQKSEHKVVETVKSENKRCEDKTKKMAVHEKQLENRQLVTPIPIEQTRVEVSESISKAEDEHKILSKTNTCVKVEQKEVKSVLDNQISEKKVVSGAQMAQRTEKKLTQDMTHKIDAVISEFQSIAVEEDKQQMLQRSRRSRSKSQIEEEVSKEKDPLEWLAKVESREISQEIKEDRQAKKEFSSTETSEKRQFEKLEKHEIIHKKAKSPKKMYVAVVESHVYTNKDVIFEDAAEFSETSSVQSADEINTFEATQALQTESVTHESTVTQNKEARKVEESHKVSHADSYSVSTIQKAEEIVHESKSMQQESHESISKIASIEAKSESVSTTKEKSRESTLDVKESKQKDALKINDTKSELKANVQIEDVTEKILVKAEKPSVKKEDEFAALKIRKEVETEIDSTTTEIEEVEVKKIAISEELQLDKFSVAVENSTISSELEVSNKSQIKTTSKFDITSTSIENYQSESHTSENIEQESSFIAKSSKQNLTLRTDLKPQESVQSAPSTIDTPTPSTVPPTPLTDEYVFQLSIPLPKSRGTTPIPRDCTLSPEEEDPHIVKKKLIPHIETTIEKIVYDTPLPTPPSDKLLSAIFKTPGLFGGSSKPIYKIKFPPRYIKPGLFGGADNPEFNKEEIREIERKSSLLASAIDETIKSIEEYKEEVGIESKKKVKIVEFKEEKTRESVKESFCQETIIDSQQNGYEESKTSIEEIVAENDVVTVNGYSESSETIEEAVSEKVKISIQNNTFETENFQELNIKSDLEGKSEDISERSSNESEKTINIMIVPQMVDTRTKVSVKINEMSEERNPEHKTETLKTNVVEEETKTDPMLGYRQVVFDPEAIPKRGTFQFAVQEQSTKDPRTSPYLTASGEIIGTMQGIVDGLEEPVMDPELAKELGKPGMSEQKIAELISGEAEMLREAHVMGLSRVLNSHMHRADDSSVDFQKIKPLLGSLKDSEVLKALNEEMARQREEERKKEEKRWTTFLQRPKRPPPKAKFGYHGWTEDEQAIVEEPYKVKIVKQAKPKVAPDYKPEDFDTGPLPWEQRAANESPEPPVEPEEPILIPELPEYLEAVDPLKESEVPDLEDTGIPLPPPREPTPPPAIETIPEEEPLIEQEEQQEEEQIEKVIEEVRELNIREAMENTLKEQLVRSVQAMVDPNAPMEQQLSQMRAQLAALAQLPEVIQQSLELVSRQLNRMGQQETHVETESHSHQVIEETQNHVCEENFEESEIVQNNITNGDAQQEIVEEIQDRVELEDQQEPQCVRVPTPQIIEEEVKGEKMQKEQHHQKQVEAKVLAAKPRLRVGNPTRMFGPPDPDSRPVVLPGGRRWRKTADVYNEQMIAETLQGQAELIKGKTLGFESDLLPFDERINFMKYEKPPVSLDHLQNSETYKLVHDMDQPPLKKVEMLRPVMAEADYRERCRSTTPSMNAFGETLAR